MASDPVILGFDTSAAHCAAALLCGDTVVASRAEEMTRGQAERLMPLLEEILAGAGLGWSDLAAIGVGTGPGNFTGVRIAVSAARGLSLALGIPAVGVNGFDAATGGADLAAWLPATRGQAWLRRPGQAPELVEGDDVPSDALPRPAAADLATAIARLAAARRLEPGPAPAPVYLRPADAAPPADPPPVILP